MLPVQAINDFQQLWKEIYNEEITFEEAQIQANRVFLAVKATYKPIEKSWLRTVEGGEKEKNDR